MTWEIALLFLILIVALMLFAFEWLPSDVTALVVLLSLILTKILQPKEAFAGFGSDTVMMILGLLIMTAALTHTGVVDIVGRAILRRIGTNTEHLLLAVMFSGSLLSAFMSNTATTAFFLPITIRLAERAQASPAKFLMPLAYSSILSSSVTLISTSTNIVVSGLMQQKGLAPLGMFELTPVGIPIMLAGLTYMYFIGRRLVPERQSAEESTFGIGSYLTEIVIEEGSQLIGKTVATAGLDRDFNLYIVRVVREDKHLPAQPELELRASDILLVQGSRDEILTMKDVPGVNIRADVQLSIPQLDASELRLVEVLLLPRCPLIGRTLRGVNFRYRFGLQALAVNRHGQASLGRKLSQIPLRMGDILLVQGPEGRVRFLESLEGIRILQSVDSGRPNVRHAGKAVTIFVSAFLLTAFNILPLAVAALLGALAMFLTRCLTPTEAYREVDWSAIILIGSMLALGEAMEKSGAAAWLAGLFTTQFGQPAPWIVLTLVFVLVVLLTQPMSNQAAAAVVLPIGLQIAGQLGMNPRTVCAMVAVAASCSYLTPLEPSCLMVYGPGNYRFRDFLIVGALLTVIIYLIAIFMVPIVWPVR